MKYNRKDFEEAPDDVKLRILNTEVTLETHNGTTKEDLLMLLRWLYNEAIDHEEFDRQKRKEIIKFRTQMEEETRNDR